MRLSDRVCLIASGKAGCSSTHPNDCNAYAVRCGERYLLIDAGAGLDTDALLRNLVRDDVPLLRIDSLLLTHAHLDHAGGAAELCQALGIQVVASDPTADLLEAGDEDAIGLTEFRRRGFYPPTAVFRPCPVARRVGDGETWSVGDAIVQCLRTPGHSSDMLTYLIQVPEGLLAFPGDTVFHGGKVLVADASDCHPASYAQSLRRLADLPIDGLFPGHLIWSLRDGKEQIAQAVPYLDRMLLPPNLF